MSGLPKAAVLDNALKTVGENQTCNLLTANSPSFLWAIRSSMLQLIRLMTVM